MGKLGVKRIRKPQGIRNHNSNCGVWPAIFQLMGDFYWPYPELHYLVIRIINYDWIKKLILWLLTQKRVSFRSQTMWNQSINIRFIFAQTYFNIYIQQNHKHSLAEKQFSKKSELMSKIHLVFWLKFTHEKNRILYHFRLLERWLKPFNKISKNPLSMFIGMYKAIEFHMPHYKIPQPTPS